MRIKRYMQDCVLLKLVESVEQKLAAESKRAATTRLRDALIHSDAKTVQLCLEQGADAKYVCSFSGETMLHVAVCCNDEWVPKCQLLIQYGADVNQEAHDGITPLHLAVCSDDVELCSFLIEQGANVNANTSFDDIDTPLARAALCNHSNVSKLLLKHGANPNLQDAELNKFVEEVQQRMSVA
jgi:26S proteasome non-ATPase regulatory subunit 10